MNYDGTLANIRKKSLKLAEEKRTSIGVILYLARLANISSVDNARERHS